MRGSRLHCSPYIVPMQLLRWYTAYNTVISANFLMRKFYGNSSEAVRFHKIFRPVNYVKCPHFTQWHLISFFSSHSYCKDGIPQFFSSDPRGCNNGDVFLFYRGEKKFLWHKDSCNIGWQKSLTKMTSSVTVEFIRSFAARHLPPVS